MVLETWLLLACCLLCSSFRRVFEVTVRLTAWSCSYDGAAPSVRLHLPNLLSAVTIHNRGLLTSVFHAANLRLRDCLGL